MVNIDLLLLLLLVVVVVPPLLLHRTQATLSSLSNACHLLRNLCNVLCPQAIFEAFLEEVGL
jgi:hypothetical protein